MPQGFRAGPGGAHTGLKSAMKGSSNVDVSKQQRAPGGKAAVTTSTAPARSAGVHFADDSVVVNNKPAPRRSTTPDYPPPPSIASDSGSSSSDWIDATTSAPVLTALKSKPRVSRMPALPPAPSSAAPMPSNPARKVSATASASRRIDDILEGGEDEDEDDDDDDEGAWDDGTDILAPAKPAAQERKPLGLRAAPASSPLPLTTSSFAAPTKASMAKASRNPASEGDEQLPAAQPASLFSGVDENTFRDQAPFAVGAAYRHAPYKRRESHLGPERRMPTGAINTSRRLSSAEAGGIGSRASSFTGAPGSRHSSGGAARASSSGVGGGGGSTSMFSRGLFPSPNNAAPTSTTSTAGGPPSALNLRAWGPPSNAAARAGRASRESMAPSSAANTSIVSTASSAAGAGGEAKVRRSAPAQALATR